jgi:hypothetical protein
VGEIHPKRGRFVTPFFCKILKLVKIMHVTKLAAGKFLNNLIGCIAWNAYFLFQRPRLVLFYKKI